MGEAQPSATECVMYHVIGCGRREKGGGRRGALRSRLLALGLACIILGLCLVFLALEFRHVLIVLILVI